MVLIDKIHFMTSQTHHLSVQLLVVETVTYFTFLSSDGGPLEGKAGGISDLGCSDEVDV